MVVAKFVTGEFVIEPQYAYAYEFTNGLVAVNLNRTWFIFFKGGILNANGI